MLWVSTHRSSSLVGQWSDLVVFLSLKINVDGLEVQSWLFSS